MTLVVSDGGCVFGAYTTENWTSPASLEYVKDPRSFLVSGLNSFGDEVTIFPPRPSAGIVSRAEWGPHFAGGMTIYPDFSGGDTDCTHYKNTLSHRHNRAVFTGAYEFKCDDVEVWSVV
jgi:hypothetical protein